jgi:hypothetical protein
LRRYAASIPKRSRSSRWIGWTIRRCMQRWSRNRPFTPDWNGRWIGRWRTGRTGENPSPPFQPASIERGAIAGQRVTAFDEMERALEKPFLLDGLAELAGEVRDRCASNR